MKASFLPTTTYGVRTVYEAGWPSPPGLFEPELGQRMMEEMLEQATLADEIGFDWISFSEHHYAPLLVPLTGIDFLGKEGEKETARPGSLV